MTANSLPRAFDFEPEDLKINRQGFLSPYQKAVWGRTRLLMSGMLCLPLLPVGFCGCFVPLFITSTPWQMALSAGLALGIAAVAWLVGWRAMWTTWRQLGTNLKSGRCQMLEGQPRYFELAGPRIAVEERNFAVTQAQMALLDPSRRYCFYVMPHYNAIVAVESLPKPKEKKS
ncbi:MAG: hypothetical protein HC915_13925 [Anaerolineae bacterium]|nr:hypothetical protein [Anaerolineae bacterium]